MRLSSGPTQGILSCRSSLRPGKTRPLAGLLGRTPHAAVHPNIQGRRPRICQLGGRALAAAPHRRPRGRGAAARATQQAGPSPSSESVAELEAPEDDDEPEAALILVACGVGLATGAGFVLFNEAIHELRELVWHRETLLSARQLLREFSELELWPKLVLAPVLGGLAVGALGLAVGGYADPEPEGGGGGSSSSNYSSSNSSSSGSGIHDSRGAADDPALDPGPAGAALRRRVAAVARPVARAVAAAVTLGMGASLGPEGPSVDIGRSVARGLGSSLRSRQRHLTSLLAAGSGAGVAAGFNAPIAGVFFAVETVLQKQMLRGGGPGPGGPGGAAQPGAAARPDDDSSGLTIAMVLLASVVAAVVSQAGLGSSPAFRVPEYRLQSLYELPLYLVFGALCGAVSATFSYSARVTAEAFDDLRAASPPATAALLPGLGGLTTGVLALGYPEILYKGFDNVNSMLSSTGDYAPGLLIQIVVTKIIATSICRGSGLQGGLYAPSIFLGAALGSAFGQLAHAVGDPAGLALSAPQAYALVGERAGRAFALPV
jgi:H+/Cl- antiporter ClcA